MRLAMCISFLVVSGAWAAAEQGLSGPAARDVVPKPLVQTACPVMGEPIKKDVVTDFEGGKVYFCCPGCIAKFNKTPNKYLPSLYKQIYPQDGQTHCPVTGKAADPQVKTEYQGKTVLFSDKDALARFKADPAQYAERLLPEVGLVARGAKADDDLFLTVGGKEETAVQKRKDLTPVAYKGSVYMLVNAEAAKVFKADSAKYVKELAAAMKGCGDAVKAKSSCSGGKGGCTQEGKSCDKEGKGCGGDGKACDEGTESCGGKNGCGKCRDGSGKGEGGCGQDKECAREAGKANAGCCKKAAASQME